jgi:hypothetical protein
MKLKIGPKIIFSIKAFLTLVIPLGIAFFYLPKDSIPIVIAVFALLIALFKELLISFYLPPKIELSTSSTPSHLVPIPIWDEHKQHIFEKQYWLHVQVENRGLTPAKNIKVIFNGIDSNIIPNISSYKSIFLKQSWLRDNIEISSLPGNTSLNLDLLFISNRKEEYLTFNFLKTPVTFIDIKCEDGNLSYIEFELKAISDNSKSKSRIFRIEYYGKLDSGLHVSIKNKKSV